jgi:hypothetical protein
VIFGGDHRVAQGRVDLVEPDDETVLHSVQLVDDVATRVVHDGGLGELGGGVLVELGQVLRDLSIDVGEGADQRDDRSQKDRNEPNEGDPHDAPRPIPLLPLYLSPLPAATQPGEPFVVHEAAIIQKAKNPRS